MSSNQPLRLQDKILALILLIGASLAILLVTFAPVLAQTSTASANKANPDSLGLSEIIVTAQRREQTLEQAPVAVTYVSGDTTSKLDIRDIQTAQLITPSMSFSSSVGFAQVFIRGIGANFAAPGLETSVTIYQDDAYQTATFGSVLKSFDLANIQVLNGPQGTLYGRNASGGVILVNTANPTDKEEARIETEFGRFGHEQVDLIANMPVSQDLKFRFAARFSNDDGYIHNEFDGKTLGGAITGAFRAKADWTPAAVPGLEALLETEYSYSYNHLDFEQERLQAPLCLGCALFGAHPPSGYYDTNQNGDFGFKQESWLNVLHVSYDVGDYLFKSVTAYHYSLFASPHGSEQDFTSANIFQFDAYVPGRTSTEDLSVQSKYQGPLNFIAGLTYIRDDRGFRSAFEGLAFAAAEVGPFAGTVPSNNSFVRTNSGSGFLEGTYQITDALSLTVGGRYNIDRRDLTTSNNPLAAAIFGNPGIREFVEFHSFTPRYVLQYATPIGNLYLSDTRGFKAGGVNTPAFAASPLIAPEKIHSDEIGLKSNWLDRRLQTNIDVFHYKVTGLQVAVIDVNAGASVTQNAAAAQATGAEFSARFAATSELTIGAGGDYLHARFTSFPDAALYCPTPTGLVSCSINLTGTVLPHAPKYTAYATAEYGFVPFSGYEASVAVVAHWTDRVSYFAGAGGPLGLDQQSAYGLVNVNAWLSPDDKRYRAGLYVDNATNTKYADFAATTGPYGAYYQAARPLTFGVKLQYKFGGN